MMKLLKEIDCDSDHGCCVQELGLQLLFPGMGDLQI